MEAPSRDESLSTDEMDRAHQPLSSFLAGPVGTAIFLVALPTSILAIIGTSAVATGSFEEAYALSRGALAFAVPGALAAALLIITYPLTRGAARDSLRVARGWLMVPVLVVFWGLLSDWQWPPLGVVIITVLAAFAAARYGYWDEQTDLADRLRSHVPPNVPLRLQDRLRLAVALTVWWGGLVVFLPALVWWAIRR